MKKEQLILTYESYGSDEELSSADLALVQAARLVTRNAYAPYSRFRVGAAAMLSNGEMITGTNQENAAYPAGICAERTLMSAASSLYPGIPIETMAISYDNEKGPSDRPISPCGICRQSLQEFEQRTGKAIRLILSGLEGKILIIPQSVALLPFAFSSDELS